MRRIVQLLIVASVSFSVCASNTSKIGCSEISKAMWAERDDIVQWCITENYKYLKTVKKYEICMAPDGEMCGYSEYINFTVDIDCLGGKNDNHEIVGLCK
ncbi:MAG: hypothetical protein KAQ98_13635 [Bacteriovoracaceae bacterium]|nr:hypothetical protein [Bacteriovoracaceae bacterium]